MRCAWRSAAVAALVVTGACAQRPAPTAPATGGTAGRTVIATFQGRIDPRTGQMTLLAPDGSATARLLVAVPEGTGAGQIEVVNDGAYGPATACGGIATFQGGVRLRSHFPTTTLQRVWVELQGVSASAHEACNSDAPPAGVSAQYGAWSYGALGADGTAEGTAVRTWNFKTPDQTAFTFTGHVLADEVPVAGTDHPATGAWSPVSEAGWAAASWARGASFTAGEGSTLQVGVYSAHATKVVLEIYGQATGADAVHDYDMKQGGDGVWRAAVAQVPGKTLYAFRAWGPNWPFLTSWARGHSAIGFQSDVDASGNRFDPNKVLYDPYAHELTHDRDGAALAAAGDNGGIFGTGGANVNAGQVYSGPLTGNVAVDRRNVDTGRYAPKAIAFEDATSSGTKPGLAQKDAAIYETHVKGLTAHPSSVSLTTLLAATGGSFPHAQNVPDSLRGTYAGAAYMAGYLKDLGYTTVEFLPVHDTDNDTNPTTHSGGNYWGYQTYGFFAPDRHYAHDQSPGGPTREFKQMVKAFHDAGLEVYLDVVYNHSGEGGTWDGTGAAAELTSFRGLDNASYYALTGAGNAFYWEATGCGNMLFAGSPAVQALVKDSLTYWATQMGVDGFRFDLAPVLGRDGVFANYDYDPNAQLLVDIAAQASAGSYEVVAEPWDTHGVQLGYFPAGWAQWNGNYRDAVRRYMKGDLSGSNGRTYADAFYGDSADVGGAGGPHKSVNMIDAHDGFTLTDLVSYDTKNNGIGWPFGASDGGNDSNDSSSWGMNQALRRQVIRNFEAFQLLSRGVPMTVWGDELGRTQDGNNNAYNVDSVATWNNYNMIATASPDAIATGDTTGGTQGYHDNLGTFAGGTNQNFLFLQYLLKLRQAHVAFRQASYAMPISYTKADGSGGFSSTSDLAARIYVSGSNVGDADFVVMSNMWSGQVTFTLPAPPSGKTWFRLVDTASWAEGNANSWPECNGSSSFNGGSTYGVNPYSIVVFRACP